MSPTTGLRSSALPSQRGRWRGPAAGVCPPVLLVMSVITVFWKLALTKQYTFLESPDNANQVMPWLQAQIYAIRHWSVLLWDPYEWFGQSLIGQVQPGVASPFTFLLALAPLHDGHIQPFYVCLWFVLMHCVAALFAYWFLRDLKLAAWPSAIGGLLYATAGFCGNTEWPQQLAAGIWAPVVFLFLLRSLAGRTPVKSAAWAGVLLGVAWLCGHHEPALMLSFAVLGTGIAAFVQSRDKRSVALRMATLFAFTGLVAAVQVLPAIEYGREAKRWTTTGALTWKMKVGIPEHEDSGLAPKDLLHVALPGGSGLRTDPFLGIVGLSLAAIALFAAFHRWEVRLLLTLAVCSVVYAMSRGNPLYGLLYVFMPAVEKSRAPIVALSVCHFSLTMLAAFGADVLFTSIEWVRESRVVKALIWLAGGLTVLLLMKPELDGRWMTSAFLAALLAAVYHLWSKGYVRRESALALVGLLVILEQSTEVGRGWPNVHDEKRTVFLKPMLETQDVGRYLQWFPGIKRVGVNDDDAKFTFGDWYRLDAAHAFTASMLTSTSELGWWQDRLVQMYGINFWVSRKPSRPEHQQEMFQGSSGIKVFANLDVLPRAWTVHDLIVAPNAWNGATMVRDWDFDLRKSAVMVKDTPKLEKCDAADKVTGIIDKPSFVQVDVEMGCKGLVIVSDNWYPGWSAAVDGNAAKIWKVNTVIRGVVVGPGRHRVSMHYRPFTVYFGLVCLGLGLAGAVVLQRRRE
ncbi:MAG TPA: hypothetical protein VG456_12420 [Candidatus Sulfopaludibacter sp.]|jgi:hypothetical protein|nr:hypothetical protein [Candidatus Sulfopaludibacter sp.]